MCPYKAFLPPKLKLCVSHPCCLATIEHENYTETIHLLHLVEVTSETTSCSYLPPFRQNKFRKNCVKKTRLAGPKPRASARFRCCLPTRFSPSFNSAATDPASQGASRSPASFGQPSALIKRAIPPPGGLALIHLFRAEQQVQLKDEHAGGVGRISRTFLP